MLRRQREQAGESCKAGDLLTAALEEWENQDFSIYGSAYMVLGFCHGGALPLEGRGASHNFCDSLRIINIPCSNNFHCLLSSTTALVKHTVCSAPRGAAAFAAPALRPVSYTHLTLPTILLV